MNESQYEEMEKRMEVLERNMEDITRLLKGDPMNTNVKGLIDVIYQIVYKQGVTDAKVKGISKIIIGLGIGLLLGAVIFGALSLTDVIKILK